MLYGVSYPIVRACAVFKFWVRWRGSCSVLWLVCTFRGRVVRSVPFVAVVSILKEPGREINYGTGKVIADESIADAKMPLRITWFADSYIDIPLHR